MRKLLLVLMICLVGLPTVYAQYWDAGNEPASYNWMQIEGEHFMLIYPEGIDSVALHFLTYIEKVYDATSADLEIEYHKKLPLILHADMVTSNAFVAWAPRRMELYMHPPLDNYPQDWLEQLALHETKHLHQYAQMYQGLTGALAKLFGEHIAAGVLGIYAPFWYIEGDAVHTETAYSNSGRGRDPEFMSEIMMAKMAVKRYSYDRAYLGSYKHNIPNHYVLGYMLVSYTKEVYGDTVWNDVLKHIAKHPLGITSFNRGLKKTIGKGKIALYKEAFEYFDSIWALESKADINIQPLMQEKKSRYFNFRSPVESNGKVYGVYSSFDKAPYIGYLDTEKSKVEKLTNLGYTSDYKIDANKDYIVWTEQINHPRWANIQYSDLYLYWFEGEKKIRLTKNKRYFSPSISSKTDKIVVVEHKRDYSSRLLILDLEGVILDSLDCPVDFGFFIYPEWSDTDNEIVAVVQSPQGQMICKWNLVTDNFVLLTKPSRNKVKQPRIIDNTLYFIATVDGIAQLCKRPLNEYRFYAVSKSAFGITNYSINDNGKITISYRSPYGERPGICDVKGDLSEFEIQEISDFMFTHTYNDTSYSKIRISDPIKSEYKAEKFKRGKNLFKFHSWAPASIDAAAGTIMPGVSFMSQNLLSTSTLVGGYEFMPGTRWENYYLDYSYKGFYPVINIRADHTRPEFISDNPSIDDFKYREDQLYVSMHIPLSKSSGGWNNYFRPEILYNITSIKHLKETYPDFVKGDFQFFGGRLLMYRFKRMALRNLYPKWGQFLELNYLTSTFGSLDLGNTWAIESISYLPGILKNHGIRIYVGHQKRIDGNNLNFSRLILLPRQYGFTNASTFSVIRTNYEFPLLYPDISIGPFAYIKRVRVKLFCDKLFSPEDNQESYGGELNFDSHVFRHFAPFTFGMGAAYHPITGNMHYYFNYNVAFSL